MQHVYKSREKVFGAGRPRPMDRNAKARLMTLARALMRRREKGKAYGPVTAKALAVLEALLWGFHNAKTGLCFPSLASLAERAGCARSTVQKALDALETFGLLVVVHRLVRRREHGPAGWRWRVYRTRHTVCFELLSRTWHRWNGSAAAAAGDQGQGISRPRHALPWRPVAR
jgi:AraC-like DNA-binding protein